MRLHAMTAHRDNVRNHAQYTSNNATKDEATPDLHCPEGRDRACCCSTPMLSKRPDRVHAYKRYQYTATYETGTGNGHDCIAIGLDM